MWLGLNTTMHLYMGLLTFKIVLKENCPKSFKINVVVTNNSPILISFVPVGARYERNF